MKTFTKTDWENLYVLLDEGLYQEKSPTYEKDVKEMQRAIKQIIEEMGEMDARNIIY